MAWHQFNVLFQYSIKTNDPKFQNGVHSLSGFWLIDVLKEILSQDRRLPKYSLLSMNKISRQQYLGNNFRISLYSNSTFILNICKSNKKRTHTMQIKIIDAIICTCNLSVFWYVCRFISISLSNNNFQEQSGNWVCSAWLTLPVFLSSLIFTIRTIVYVDTTLLCMLYCIVLSQRYYFY